MAGRDARARPVGRGQRAGALQRDARVRDPGRPGRGSPMRRTLVIGAVALLGHAPGALAQAWTELGHEPLSGFAGATGRVSAVAWSRTSAGAYYAGGAEGGVWRSLDGGASWTPLTSNTPTSAVGALVLDPVNESTIYVGTGEANFANHSRYGLGVLKSTDAGATWSLLGGATF